MKTCRVHIMGASGAGVTTLGRALADALAVSHHDVDDYYWLPTNPPYRQKRTVDDRLRLMREIFLDREGWILSGSLDGWGASVVPLFDAVVFVCAPTEVRLRRLREREARHFGDDAVSPGGWQHQTMEEFIEWASHYDDGSREGRNLMRHQAWLATLTCPHMRLDGTRPIPDLVSEVIAALVRR
jgi:adenylate kinase family enzyme